jgi:hypothetical protein
MIDHAIVKKLNVKKNIVSVIMLGLSVVKCVNVKIVGIKRKINILIKVIIRNIHKEKIIYKRAECI